MWTGKKLCINYILCIKVLNGITIFLYFLIQFHNSRNASILHKQIMYAYLFILKIASPFHWTSKNLFVSIAWETVYYYWIWLETIFNKSIIINPTLKISIFNKFAITHATAREIIISNTQKNCTRYFLRFDQRTFLFRYFYWVKFIIFARHAICVVIPKRM